MIKKQCTKCQQWKIINEFYKDKRTKIGLQSRCKKCINEINKKWVQNNKDKVKENRNRWRKNNPEKVKKINKRNYENHKEEKQKYGREYSRKHKVERKQYRQEHKKELKEYSKKYYREHKEEKRKYYEEHRKEKKEYRTKNIKHYNKWNRKHQQQRRKIDICFRIKHDVSISIRDKLKKQLLSKNGQLSFGDLLLYTPKELKKHLENQFESWMNWNNWSNKVGYWTIDHIIPQSSFNFANSDGTQNIEEIRKCWALKNLQPLEWMENIIKSNKLNYKKID